MIFLFAPVSDEPEVFLPKYSQTAILHAAHFQWVVKRVESNQVEPISKAITEGQVDSLTRRGLFLKPEKRSSHTSLDEYSFF